MESTDTTLRPRTRGRRTSEIHHLCREERREKREERREKREERREKREERREKKEDKKEATTTRATTRAT